MLSREVLRKIRRMHLHARFLVRDALSGEYQSSFKGQGMEFEEVREYTPGDDVRSIDWNVSARMNSIFVKKYREERELTVILLVDVSRSGAFGTQQAFKREVAAELASAIAYMAIQNNDKVGVVLFSDEVEKYVVPQKGRNHVLRVIREVLAFEAQGKKTNIRGALEFLSRVANRRSVVFLLSDFIDEGYEKILRCMARKHDLVAISIRDRLEESLPSVGFLELQDAETGEVLLVDSSSAAFRLEYEKRRKQWMHSLNYSFKKAGVGHVAVRAEESYMEPLLAFFKRRPHSLRRFTWVLCPIISLLLLKSGVVLAQGEIRDLKPLYAESMPYRWVAFVVAVVILMTVGLFLLAKYLHKRRKKVEPVVFTKQLTSSERALAALESLVVPTFSVANSEESQAQSAHFHYALSSIVRQFVEDDFCINATDLTTEELSALLKQNHAIDEFAGLGSCNLLRQLLSRGDEIKFARTVATTADLAADKETARNLVVRIGERRAQLQAKESPA